MFKGAARRPRSERGLPGGRFPPHFILLLLEFFPLLFKSFSCARREPSKPGGREPTSRAKEVSELLRSPAKVSDTGTSPRNKGAAAHSQKSKGRGREEEEFAGAVLPPSSPSPPFCPGPAGAVPGSGCAPPAPAAFPSLLPAGAAPVLAGSRAPPRLPPTLQGVSVPPQASRGHPIPNCGRLPAGSAGGCGQGGRGARRPPEAPVPVPAAPMPRSLGRTEPAPSPLRPGKVGGRAGAAGGQGGPG